MRDRMRRVVLRDLRSFAFEDVDRPSPAPGEALIRVQRVGICGSDISAFYGRHPYIHCPIVPGHEFSGVVAGVGEGVAEVQAGTRCTVIPHLVCGECPACVRGAYNLCGKLRVLGAQADGAFTEYLCVPAKMAMPIPDALSMEQAALVEPCAVGYHAARRGAPSVDETALVFGAGPIGMFTMQCIRALGPKKVIIADKDAARLALADSLGADGTIDLSVESVDQGLVRLIGCVDSVDLFFDCVGFGGQALDDIIRIARRGARVVVAGVLEKEYAIPHLPDFVEHELTLLGSAMYVPQDFADVIDLMNKGIVRIDGIISHSAPLWDVAKIFHMIDSRSEPFFKIMLHVD